MKQELLIWFCAPEVYLRIINIKKEFTDDEIQINNKHVKRYWNLIITEMQIDWDILTNCQY